MKKNKNLWLDEFFNHGDGIALMPDRTSTKWWQSFAKRADGLLFVTPKIKFEKRDGSSRLMIAELLTICKMAGIGSHSFYAKSKDEIEFSVCK